MKQESELISSAEDLYARLMDAGLLSIAADLGRAVAALKRVANGYPASQLDALAVKMHKAGEESNDARNAYRKSRGHRRAAMKEVMEQAHAEWVAASEEWHEAFMAAIKADNEGIEGHKHE
jgi:hypothetical protein